ncbi:hypothetical protein Mapa_005509 [Marchantia paleacea]|nr:hypothetical protein Mapa_005509 [Marchantia paleacea]
MFQAEESRLLNNISRNRVRDEGMMPNSMGELEGGRSLPESRIEGGIGKGIPKNGFAYGKAHSFTTPKWQECASPTRYSDKESMSPTVPEPEPEVSTPVAFNKEDYKSVDEFLNSHAAFLDDLRKKVTETPVKDRVLIFENLQWEILREAGNLSWFGLAFKLVGYITTRSHSVAYCHEKIETLQQQVDYIGDQIDELKLCLETDSDIFKIAAGTILYTFAAIRHIEQKVDTSQRYTSCCSPVSAWMVRKSLSEGVPTQLDDVLSELKVLQDNLMFATLAAVGNRVAQSVIKKPPALQTMSIGLDQHISHIISFFQKPGVCLVGIYGHAGVGKTMLLNEVVTTLQKTQKRLFASVEVGERPDDLRKLQASLLQQLGGGKKEFTSTAQGRNALLYQLQKLKHNNKQARIAIDNLFDIRLIGELFPHSLGKVLPLKSSLLVSSPSLAIINRLDQLCRPAMPQYHFLPYKLPSLSAQQAKTLFLSHAASEPVMSQGMLNKYVEMVDQVVPLCDGNPLALKVTGSYFSDEANQSEEHWSSISKKMKLAEELDSPEDQMFGKLQVIYDRLDMTLKEAFLDISIFFRGWDWRIVDRIVGKPAMKSLMSQALIAASKKDTESLYGIAQWTRYSEHPWKVELVGMHDLLAAIGSRRAQGNRVQSEDQTHLPERLLVDGPGNELSNIKGLSLLSCKEALQGHMLERMSNLRLLILHDTGVRGYCTKALSQLQFFYWGRSQPASEVKIPFQMNRMKKLEVVILRAHEIDLNLKFPPQLRDLTLIGCNNMEELPDTVAQLTGLAELHLYSCSRLQDLTEAFGNLRTLYRFRMENCGGIKELPRSLGHLINLKEMDLSGCQNLTSLPPEIGTLCNLERLDLSRCKSLTLLPSEIGGLRSLTYLSCAHCALTSICPEIGKLGMLEELSLTNCARLEKLPKEIGSLAFLERLNLSSCIGLKELPREIGCLGSLLRLSLSTCTALLRLPEELWCLTTLQSLDLDYCKHLTHLPKEIGNLTSLQKLSLNCCTKLTKLPTEITGLRSLQVLNLVGCTGLKGDLPPGLHDLTNDDVEVHKDDDSVILEGPVNPSFKLYTVA